MKRFLIIVALFVMLSPIRVYAGDEEITLYSKAAVLMDADSGRVLYEKNGEEILPMASTTKIMTLILALELGNLDDTVTVSGYAASMPQVKLGMKKDEQYILKDLLYSLILESHNDSAVAVAEHIAGSVEEFAALMNAKANEIGCEDTYYVTPNGLDGEDNGKIHSTTAKDLALVMAYCVKKSPMSAKFLEITRTRSYAFTDVTGKQSFSCTNRNSFLDMMAGAISGKTGYTASAGYCYVGALENDGRTFVVALLACGWPNNKTYKWTDTKKLMNYGIENFEYRNISDIELPEYIFDEVYVNNAVADNLNRKVYVKPILTAKTGVDGLLMARDEKIEINVQKINNISAPIEKGTVVGYVSCNTIDGEWARWELVIDENIEIADYNWCLGMVIKSWFIKK